ncbi:uncharacterized protein LOC132953544 [Metopolophium dirhodum]|uniref:uncharacterized protein LOC132953544 n=1 Tax=Metopolophium dirhodum TaxID=44670 RepID=UPI00299023DF|nr:uncharacterized protein LOC132953544 [Metopolophium dirhodum]
MLQVNLNHCWTAQQLLAQTVVDRNIDVLLICDYYRGFGDDPRWVDSADHKCGLLVTSRRAMPITDKGAGAGYAWARIGGTYYFSCYWTPNCTLQEFDNFLNGVEWAIWNSVDNLLVAGDFNAHLSEWGSARDDARGSLLSGLASSLGLLAYNVGSEPTYSRVNAESVIDVTFARFLPNANPLVENWSVLTDLDSASDHSYVEFSVIYLFGASAAAPVVHPGAAKAWATKKLSPVALEEHWRRTRGASLPLPTSAPAEDHVAQLQQYLVDSCDAAMPRRTIFQGKRAVHWWCKEIAELRKSSIAARR